MQESTKASSKEICSTEEEFPQLLYLKWPPQGRPGMEGQRMCVCVCDHGDRWPGEEDATTPPAARPWAVEGCRRPSVHVQCFKEGHGGGVEWILQKRKLLLK